MVVTIGDHMLSRMVVYGHLLDRVRPLAIDTSEDSCVDKGGKLRLDNAAYHKATIGNERLDTVNLKFIRVPINQDFIALKYEPVNLERSRRGIFRLKPEYFPSL